MYYYIFAIIIPLLCISELLNKNQRYYLHTFITFYILFGSILSNESFFIKLHMFILCLIMIHWLLNNNRCYLSDMDNSDNSDMENNDNSDMDNDDNSDMENNDNSDMENNNNSDMENNDNSDMDNDDNIDYNDDIEPGLYTKKILKDVLGIEFNTKIINIISWTILIVLIFIDLFLLQKYYR